MSTFQLPNITPSVEVKLPPELTREQLLSFRPFTEWLETLQKSLALQDDPNHDFHDEKERYWLRSITVHAPDMFGKRIGFLKMETKVQNQNDKGPLPGVVLLRGGSIAVLMILRPQGDKNHERYVILTQQPRIPAGSLTFSEIPAGMIDDANEFSWAAKRELKEETGLTIPVHELKNMTELALADSECPESHLQKAMYPSPGGCDEFIPLFLWERTMKQTEIFELAGKLKGTDREKIKLKVVPYDQLWREGARDSKTLAAWALYEGLDREGKLKR